MKRVVIAVSALLVLLLVATVGISWKASSSLLEPKDDPFPDKPAGLVVDDVEFKSSDNVSLSGWFIPAATSPAPAVVLSHGRGTNRTVFSKEIPLLHAAGFSLLAFDYRGQGRSQQVKSTAGAREQLDLDAAIAFLRGQRGVKPGTVSVLGKSLGASIAMLTAADNPNVGAVVDESGFAKLADVVGYNFNLETGLPEFPFAPLSVKIAEARTGVDLGDVDVTKTVRHLSPRPLLVVHATRDTRVKFDQSDKIFDAARDPKSRWTLDSDEHADAISADPRGYEEHVVKFLEANS